MEKLKRREIKVWQVAVYLALAAALAWVGRANWSSLKSGLAALVSANLTYVLLGAALTVATFFIAAASYQALLLRKLRYRRTVLVELAAAFISRLLPAGLGGLGLNGDYLHRGGHSPAEATLIVSMNTLLAIIGNVLLVSLALIV